MKSFRSQSRLDLTMSQKVSSAGAPAGKRGETHQTLGLLRLFQSNHFAGPQGWAGPGMPSVPRTCGEPGVAQVVPSMQGLALNIEEKGGLKRQPGGWSGPRYLCAHLPRQLSWQET